MFEYKSSGLVYGLFWGGGYGSYPAEKLENKTKKGLIKKAIEMLDGRLDSGMGFESLKGAILHIEEIESIVKNGKGYGRSEFEINFIGELTKKEKEFLIDNLINQ